MELPIDEEVRDFGVLLVTIGSLAVCAEGNDLASSALGPGSLVANLQPADIDPVRVLSCEPSQVALISRRAVEEILADAGDVLDRMRAASLEAAARASAVAGPLGEVDEATRFGLLERATLRRIEPNEIFLRRGERCPGLIVVGAGTLCAGTREFERGQLVFPELAAERKTISTPIVAGERGARALVISPGALAVLSASNAAVSALLVGDV
jgi:hypothetical protein